MMYEITPLLRDVYLEIVIVALAGWALWNTLPRDPKMDWTEFSQRIRNGLSGNQMESLDSNPLMLLQWDQIYLHSETLRACVQRRLSDHILIGVDSLASVWSEWLGLKLALVTANESENAMSLLESALENRAERFVIVSNGTECQEWLEFLHQYPAVRDFTAAVIFLEPELSENWISEHFNHDEMDVEANISVPYFVLSREPSTYLTTPPANSMGWKAIEVIALQDLNECDLQSNRTAQDNEWLAHCLSILIAKRKEGV